jgi:predicted DNA-binding protein with PD1-like motif
MAELSAQPVPLYVPAGNWLVQSLTEFCEASGLGNVAVSGIGSITNVWVLLNPTGTVEVRNFPGPGSYEMTSVLGNVVLRQGIARFDVDTLPSGAYPTFDQSVDALNPYAHLHTTFAMPDFSIAGGHLLDAQVSIGAELMLSVRGVPGCAGGAPNELPPDCVVSEPVSVPPFGTFSNWDRRWWFPNDADEQS